MRRRKEQMARAWRGAVIVAALLTLVPAPVLAASEPTDRDVKAAFLYHFAQYVEWPEATFASSQSPFVLGVVGDGGFLPAISAAVADKSVAGHRIVVRAVRLPSESRECHMVFVTSSETSRLPRILASLDSQPVLSVGDAGGFARAGGVIGLVIKDGKVGFQINPMAARRAGLKISSKLLRLAEIVDAD